MKFIGILICSLFFFISCKESEKESASENDAMSISFNGRTIDLRPYFEGFPFSGFQAYYKAGKVFYYYEGPEGTEFRMAPLDEKDLMKGVKISDVDYSKRNVWAVKYNEKNGCLYWMGDEKNDEKIDLFRLDPKTKKLDKLTDVPYIFAWNWNKDKDRLAYVVRLGDIDKRLGDLRIMDMASGKSEIIMQDTPEMRFTWSNIAWRPDGSGLVLTGLKKSDRTFANVIYVDLKSGKMSVLTDPASARSFPEIITTWLNNDEFAYISNEAGYADLYKHNVATGKRTRLTSGSLDLGGADVVELDGKNYIMTMTQTPVQNELALLDPQDGRQVFSQATRENLEVLDSDKNKLLVTTNSTVNKFRIDEITVSSGKFAFRKVLDMPEKVRDEIVNATVEKVSFPTFDIDPATGQPRMLHAYLYKPENPLPKDKQMVMIQSFYGGQNSYNQREHILASAGIYVLSPAPRGSTGFGKDFYALNDKDLGGNEIIDVIYAAKYISEKLGIPSSRVGVFGGSHGGYATMRCLTFPGGINGNKASFDWGFGISHAGFSDIIHFYNHCNIPDWVTLEAGDPKTEAVKLNDRSPLYHADKMKGKLLLTHGKNDNRVPIEGSRYMADSLKKYGKEVYLEEYEGTGHHIKGLRDNVRQYRSWFRFLESVR